MPRIYQLSDLDLGEEIPTGHVVYKKSFYRPDKKKLIYKKNKYNNKNLSRYEVAFSDLANLIIAPSLTPRQFLVKNNNEITGVASLHFCYTIAEQGEVENRFYRLNIKNEEIIGLEPVLVKQQEDIPIYFLNELPSGTFAKFRQMDKKGELDLDMDSLANVLCGSYTLEEDDLHKGNFGFYIAKEKPRIIFFKIDNDLMLSDSVMSFCDSRIVNWRHREHAFDITRRDLLRFPKLLDSQNYYWPTTRRYIINPSDPKVYTDKEEIEAFSSLARSKKFRRAKWRAWYKHLLIETPLIEFYLARSLDKRNPEERAQLFLISQSVIGRLSKLKAVLFSLPDFRTFVATITKAESRTILNELCVDLAGDQGSEIEALILKEMQHYQELCVSEYFDPEDTPLHVAIRLGDYRYHETWQSFKHFANQSNLEGCTPLDLVINLATTEKPGSKKDVRKDPFFIMNHLLDEGVKRTKSYQKFKKINPFIRSYRFSAEHLNKANGAESAGDLIEVLRRLGEDHRFSLKMKKEIAVDCLGYFIHMHQKNPDLAAFLMEFKLALNGNKTKTPCPELQFIRQLRSNLWIVRIFRGLLGGSSTQVTMNELVTEELKRLKPSVSCWSLFFSKPELSIPNSRPPL